MEYPDREEFLRNLLGNQWLHYMVAEAVAAFLDMLPPRTRVGFYACGGIARALVRDQRAALERLDAFFILTDPKGIDAFEGFPLLGAARLHEAPPDHVVILSTQHEQAMAAQISFLPGHRVHRLGSLIARHGLDGMMAKVLAALSPKVWQAAERMATELPPGMKRILFFSPRPPQHLVKVMREAVRQGYAVAVVVEDPLITPNVSLAQYSGKGYFHSLYVAEHWSPVEFLELEKGLAPHALHLEVSMGTARSIDCIMACRRTPAAVEYRDFPQTVFRTREEAIQAWRLAPEEYDREVACQRRIYASADGVIMKDAPETLDFLDELYGHRPDRVLQFYPYFSEEWAAGDAVEKLSARTGEPHLVYAGGVVNDPKWHNYPLYRSLLAAGRVLAAQGIHLTIYNAGDATGEGFADYLALDRESPYFHYHPGVAYADLKTVLPMHDFGWLCFDFSEARENPFFHRITMGSKVFTYLEAGLPILISPEQEFMAHMVTEEMGIGLRVGFEALPGLAALLRTTDWEPIRQNLRNAREAFTYSVHGHELRDFYEALSGTARCKPEQP